MIGDAGEDVGEPGLGVDVIELAGFDEGVDRGRAPAAGVRAAKGPVAASDGNHASILPISGRMSSSNIVGIRYMGNARAGFRASDVQRATSFMWS